MPDRLSPTATSAGSQILGGGDHHVVLAVDLHDPGGQLRRARRRRVGQQRLVGAGDTVVAHAGRVVDRVGLDVQRDRRVPAAEADTLAGEAVAADLQDAAGELHELAQVGGTDTVIPCRRAGSGCRPDAHHLSWRERRQHRVRHRRGRIGVSDGCERVAEIPQWRELLALSRRNVHFGAWGGCGSELGGQQLGDLNGVQRRAFSQVVARDEQRQSAAVRHAGVLADAADERVVDTGGGQRRRHVDQLHARRRRQQLARPLDRQRPGELGVDRQRVPGVHRHPHAGAAHQQVGDAEDLAALVAQLLVLVGLAGAVVDERTRQRHHVERDRRDVLRPAPGSRAPSRRAPAARCRRRRRGPARTAPRRRPARCPTPPGRSRRSGAPARPRRAAA